MKLGKLLVLSLALAILAGLVPQSDSVAASTTYKAFIPMLTSQAAATTQPSPSAPMKAVQLAWFYKPPRDGNLQPVIQHFSDAVVLSKGDEQTRDQLRAQGISGPYLQYIRFEAIQDPGSCTAQPWRNQVADRPGDFCAISAQHPDWFLLDGNGNRIVEVEGDQRFYLMDPGNAGWRAFWLQRVRETQEQNRWDGVFLDNVEASLSKRVRNGALPARYPSDAAYQQVIKAFLAEISTNYFRPQGRPLQGNIIELKDAAIWFSYLQHLEGAMEEGWAVDWRSGYLTQAQWEEHLSRVERTQALGKTTILVSQGSQSDAQRQQFAFGSFLLVTNGKAAFRYSNANYYRDAWVYSNYGLDLGAPLGPRYKAGSLWKRDFSNGSVTVDPAAHTATIVVR